LILIKKLYLSPFLPYLDFNQIFKKKLVVIQIEMFPFEAE